ncbi:CLUMA_CG018703, isoform A [Clunio marinus]|uniref:CLUMA_CG018703, isoform A n=1 Tax=Clunio marinus TaxID=568069 RepID=A0A1J1J2J9_9DIPT|nr:CLUMA_CG018703, isoform A [Clunio marinus]
MKYLTGVIGLIICLSVVVESVVFTDCGSIKGKFTKVSVSNCDETKPKCVLKRGTNATVNIDFQLNNEIEKEIKVICHGKVSGLDVPFKLPNPDACVNSGLSCPLKKGIVYQYTASFPILKIYPKLDVEVRFELRNSEGKDIICVVIPSKIQ